jgi:hypothetical protein
MSTVAIVSLSLSITTLLCVAAADPPTLTSRDFTPGEVDIMISGYRDQVSLMLQIGAPMVAGLAAAVGFLVHALLRGHRVLVNEVRSNAIERVNLSRNIGEIAQILYEKPCLHEKYLQGLAEDRDKEILK